MEPAGRQQPLPQSASAATALVPSGDISAAPRCAGSSRNPSLSADLRPAAAGAVHLPSLRSGSARSSISLGALPLRAIDFASGICSLVFMLGGLRVLLVGESRLLVLGGARWVRDRTGATVLTERSASHDYFGPRYNSRTFFGPHIIWYGSHF
jgi:hypothetical protein